MNGREKILKNKGIFFFSLLFSLLPQIQHRNFTQFFEDPKGKF